MKLSQLSMVTEATKGKWQIGNLKGVYKNFKTKDSADALAWMRNRCTEEEAKDLIWQDNTWTGAKP